MVESLAKDEEMTKAMDAVPGHDNEDLLSDGLARVPEATRFLGLGRSKLYELMDAGELPYCKFGKARRIPWRAVRNLAAESIISAS